jgi:hypothetical protein
MWNDQYSRGLMDSGQGRRPTLPTSGDEDWVGYVSGYKEGNGLSVAEIESLAKLEARAQRLAATRTWEHLESNRVYWTARLQRFQRANPQAKLEDLREDVDLYTRAVAIKGSRPPREEPAIIYMSGPVIVDGDYEAAILDRQGY